MELRIDEEIASLLPKLSDDEYQYLKQSIEGEGCRDPVVVWKQDKEYTILDGHNRHKICQELGKTCDTIEMNFSSKEEAIQWVIKNQVGKRNLSAADKRRLITQYLKMEPEKSDRQIAKETGVDHKTVGKARRKLEDGGEIPHRETVIGKDGVEQPREKKPVEDAAKEPNAEKIKLVYPRILPKRRSRPKGAVTDVVYKWLWKNKDLCIELGRFIREEIEKGDALAKDAEDQGEDVVKKVVATVESNICKKLREEVVEKRLWSENPVKDKSVYAELIRLGLNWGLDLVELFRVLLKDFGDPMIGEMDTKAAIVGMAQQVRKIKAGGINTSEGA